jgi:hypothetical protein
MDGIEKLFPLIANGGYIAIAAFLLFLILDVKKRLERVDRVIEKLVEKFDQNLEHLERRVEIIERDFVSREEHYRDFSGWREELRHIDRKIDSLYREVFNARTNERA